ncbi:hypothetical protein GCM10020254_54180 [Streptomyces goshikiensis]
MRTPNWARFFSASAGSGSVAECPYARDTKSCPTFSSRLIRPSSRAACSGPGARSPGRGSSGTGRGSSGAGRGWSGVGREPLAAEAAPPAVTAARAAAASRVRREA